MKKILFPTDFSEVANNAFVHALQLAKLIKGELVLLHTFEQPIIDSQFTPDNYYMIFESMQLAQFDLFKDEIPKLRAIAEANNLADIKLSHRFIDGDLVYTIKKAIDEEAINFVVMGTSGETGWESFFIGSNTGAVVSAVTVPVLSVPLTAKFKKIETIGFTTRYREKDKKALIQVLQIAKKTKAEVRCLYVKTSNSDVSDAIIKQWEKEFQHEPIHFLVLPSDDVQGVILDFLTHKSIDILAMVTYKRNFFSELFNPSLTRKIANFSEIPILALHEN
jgi:nucleotide-binding universal stress UspA family protein